MSLGYAYHLSEVLTLMPRSQTNDLSAFGRHAPGAALKRVLSWTRAAGSGWLGRRKAYVLRGLAVRALCSAPVDVETMGVNMRLYPHNNICEKFVKTINTPYICINLSADSSLEVF